MFLFARVGMLLCGIALYAIPSDRTHDQVLQKKRKLETKESVDE
ncbi:MULTISPECIES: hypothetical protein [Enterococcus]|nr:MULTISPECIES: hypothetical protein [Enterococcus]